MYLAQVLEHAIVNAMIVLDLVPNVKGKVKSVEEWEERFDAFMEMHFERTFGKLVTAIRAVAVLPDELVEAPKECNRRRNYLVHTFFRVQAEDFMNEKGRWQMVKELRQIESLFTRTTHSFEQVMKPEWEKHGMRGCASHRWGWKSGTSPGAETLI
jgi:hypothetical protein